MKWAFIVAIVIFAFSFPPTAEAIVFLPALVLIPIIKILAVIIGSMAIPAVGTGVIWRKVSGKPLKEVVFFMVLGLILLTAFVTILLKLTNPERPFF